MYYGVNVKKEYQKSKSKFLRCSLLFSGLLTLTLAIDALLIIFASDEYTVNLVVSIFVTIAFSWFAIYFFTNVYRDVNATYRYYKGYQSGIKQHEEAVFIDKVGEVCYVNGLYVYPICIKTYDGIKSQNKIIYTLDEGLTFYPNTKLNITTYQRILIEAETL